MKRIPRQFTLFNVTYTTRIVSNATWERVADEHQGMDDCVGYLVPSSGMILIRRSDDYSHMFFVWCHEVGHAMSYHAGYKDWRTNERRADLMGGMLAQFLTTMK